MWRRISSSAMPTRVNSCGRSKISPNCRFQQTRCQLLVEHGDALAHVIERGLQDFAVVVDRRIGVVEQLERRLGRHRALAQQQRQHEPRRRRADRRGEQIFGVLQELEIGLGLRRRGRCGASPRSLRRTRGCAPRRDSAPPSRSAPRPSPRRAAAGSSARSACSVDGTNTSACTRSIAVGRRPSEQPI